MQWNDGTHHFDVTLHGAITFTDDLTDVQSLSDGGYLTIRDWSHVIPHTVEIRSSGGTLTHAYYVAGLSRPWDESARRWLSNELPVLVRRSGLGAESRVRSILDKKGVSGVLEEIALLGGDYARRLYFVALVEAAHLDATGVQPVLLQVGQRMTSDYERGQVLRHVASQVKLDERAASAYVQAVGTMKSDYERRRALSTLLATRPLPPGVSDLALRSAADMRSDYDRGEVLRTALANGGSLAQGDALFTAVDRMTSSYEKRRVLSEVIDRGPLGAAAKKGVLQACAGIQSDYDRGQVLTAYVQIYAVEAAVREPFFAAVRSIKSDYERRRVLTEVAKNRATSGDVQQAAFEVVTSMVSDYDRAEVLLAFLNAQELTAASRQAFVAAAERIKSAHEQNRVLAALVKSERR